MRFLGCTDSLTDGHTPKPNASGTEGFPWQRHKKEFPAVSKSRFYFDTTRLILYLFLYLLFYTRKQQVFFGETFCLKRHRFHNTSFDHIQPSTSARLLQQDQPNKNLINAQLCNLTQKLVKKTLRFLLNPQSFLGIFSTKSFTNYAICSQKK